MKHLTHLFLTITALFICQTAFSQTNYTWNGGTDTDFATSTNWTPNGVPGSGDNITIVSTSNAPVLDGNRTVNNLTMTSGILKLGGYDLTVDGTADMNGGEVENGLFKMTQGNVDFDGTEMDCTVDIDADVDGINNTDFKHKVDLVSSGAFNAGGNHFSDTTKITQNSGGYTNFGLSSPDTFLAPVTFDLNTSGIFRVVFNASGMLFDDGIILNNNTGNTNHGFVFGASGSPNITVNGDIELNVTTGSGYINFDLGTTTHNGALTIGSTGYNSGNLTLKGYEQTAATAVDLSAMTGTSGLILGPNLTLEGDLTASTTQNTAIGAGCLFKGVVDVPQLSSWSGSTFEKKADLNFANALNTGGNVFKDSTTITFSKTGYGNLGLNAPDTFLAPVTINLDGAGFFRLNFNGAGTLFDDDVVLNNRTGTTIHGFEVGASGSPTTTINGDVYLNTDSLSGYTNFNLGTNTHNGLLKIGADGFHSGLLTLKGYTQTASGSIDLSAMNHNASLAVQTGADITADFTCSVANTATLNAATFRGDVYVEGTSIPVTNCDFLGTAHLKKTGAVNNLNKGNVFHGATTIENASAANYLYFGFQVPDTFLTDVTLINRSSLAVWLNFNQLCHLGGNLTLDGDSAKTINIGSYTSGVKAVFDGTTDQHINILEEDLVINAYRLEVDKPSGRLNLNGDITIDDELVLTDGIIENLNGSVLTLNDGVIPTASDDSYVEGKVQKVGNDAFDFPVGRNGHYRPISISAPSNATHAFTAEYFESNSDWINSHGDKDGSLDYLSTNEYWTLTRDVGTSTPTVTLSWDTLTSCVMNTDLSTYHIAGWDGSNWDDLGNGATTGNSYKGTISTASAVSDFNMFVLESDSSKQCAPCQLSDVLSRDTVINYSFQTSRKWYTIYSDSTDVDIVFWTSDSLENGFNLYDNIFLLKSCGLGAAKADTNVRRMSFSDRVILRVVNSHAANYLYLKLDSANIDSISVFHRTTAPTPPVDIIGPTEYEGCGVEYSFDLVATNQRVQGQTLAGDAFPVDLDITYSGNLLAVHFWANTVRGPDLQADYSVYPSLTFGVEGPQGGTTTIVAPLIASDEDFEATGWNSSIGGGNPNDVYNKATCTYSLELPLSFVLSEGTGSYTFTQSLVSADEGFDITGIAAMPVYQIPCDEDYNRLVFWETCAVAQQNSSYTGTGLGGFATNTNEEGFLLIADVQQPDNSVYFNFGIPANVVVGDMYNFETTNLIDITNGQGNLNLNITQQVPPYGDVYCVAMFGAHFQDPNGDCTQPEPEISGPTSTCDDGSGTWVFSIPYDATNQEVNWSVTNATVTSSLSNGGHTFTITAWENTPEWEDQEICVEVITAEGCTANACINVEGCCEIDAGNGGTICEGEDLQLEADDVGLLTYSWSPSAGLSSTTVYNPIASPTTTTTYTLTVTTPGGNQCSDDVTVTVTPASTTITGPETCAEAQGDWTFSVPNDPTDLSVVWTVPAGVQITNNGHSIEVTDWGNDDLTLNQQICVEITNANNCVESDCIDIEGCCLPNLPHFKNVDVDGLGNLVNIAQHLQTEIVLEGTLTVDEDLTFDGDVNDQLNIWLYPGTNIVTDGPDVDLAAKYTTFDAACPEVWDDISVLESTQSVSLRHCVLRNSEFGLVAQNGCSVTLVDNIFEFNATQHTSFVNGDFSTANILANTFRCSPAGNPNPYWGASYDGVLPNLVNGTQDRTRYSVVNFGSELTFGDNPIPGNQNLIKDSHYGILCLSGSLDIENTRFENIVQDDASGPDLQVYNGEGFCIVRAEFATDPATNLDYLNVDGCEFESSDQGIWAFQNENTEIINSSFEDIVSSTEEDAPNNCGESKSVGTAIWLEGCDAPSLGSPNCGFANYLIEDNEFDDVSHGIRVINVENGNVEIEDNDLYWNNPAVDMENGGPLRAYSILVSNSFPSTNLDVSVANCTIENAWRGIHLQNMNGADFNGNTITADVIVQDNVVKIHQPEHAAGLCWAPYSGIQIDNAVDITIASNEIYSNINFAWDWTVSGIRSYNSAKSDFYCNITHDMGSAIHLIENNATLQIVNTDMEDLLSGVVYDRAVTGPQGNSDFGLGNRWEGVWTAPGWEMVGYTPNWYNNFIDYGQSPWYVGTGSYYPDNTVLTGGGNAGPFSIGSASNPEIISVDVCDGLTYPR